MDDRRSILIVEDSDEDFHAMMWAWQKAGIATPVARCANGEQALDLLFRRGKYAHVQSTELPAMIILDLNLPLTDGRSVLAGGLETERRDPGAFPSPRYESPSGFYPGTGSCSEAISSALPNGTCAGSELKQASSTRASLENDQLALTNDLGAMYHLSRRQWTKSLAFSADARHAPIRIHGCNPTRRTKF